MTETLYANFKRDLLIMKDANGNINWTRFHVKTSLGDIDFWGPSQYIEVVLPV